MLLAGCGLSDGASADGYDANGDAANVTSDDSLNGGLLDGSGKANDDPLARIAADETLSDALSHSQLIIAEADGTTAHFTMYDRAEDGSFSQSLSADGYVGEEGVGEASEYKKVTPRGVYGFNYAFGIKPDPGCTREYIQVDDSYYWVDDPDSRYYNRFVSTDEVSADWDSAEHIIDCGYAYNYVLSLDYNPECVPGAGSAIFLHCTENKPTSGCLSVPEQTMIEIMQGLRDDCVIVIP